jgi:S-(hydroxymethyl)glutathione dehydrogenase/alcohol dehydrogenase
MRAAILESRGASLEIASVTVPDLADDEVRVRLTFSGVCRSDYHVLAGEWRSTYPVILGHEGAGIVEAVGSAVRDVGVGDHVILSWTPYCRRCFFCLRGETFLCDAYASGDLLRDRAAFLFDERPVARFAAVGSFAEVAVVQETAAVRIPPEMPLDKAALLGCAVATGVGAVLNTARVPAGSTVLVIGCGGVGLSTIQGARIASASRILALDTNEAKLALALKMGATDVFNVSAGDPGDWVGQITGGRGVDFAFEAIGIGRQIELAVELVRAGGTAVVVGQTADGDVARIDGHRLSDRGKALIGCNYGSSRPPIDFPRLVDFYLSGRLDLDPLVSRSRPLVEVNEAFADLATGEIARTVLEL